MTELKTDNTDLQDALRLRELVIDVRKSHGRAITAEACYQKAVGTNLVRHGASGEEPESVLAGLIEAVERLGISAESYRIVREDLPPQPVIEYRYPVSSETVSKKHAPGRECEVRGHPLCGGECEEEDVVEEGESCGCRYCLCMNETEFGETCSECRAGAHQG